MHYIDNLRHYSRIYRGLPSKLTLSSMQSMTTEGYFLVSHLKKAGTPMVRREGNKEADLEEEKTLTFFPVKDSTVFCGNFLLCTFLL